MTAGPKTVKEAMALAEIPSLVNTDVQLFLGAGGIDGDGICAFIDADGVSKRVECIRRSPDGPDEWVKTPL